MSAAASWPADQSHEIAADIEDELAGCHAERLAELEHLLARHAAFEDYCREHPEGLAR